MHSPSSPNGIALGVNIAAQPRRRSVDVGGLALALSDESLGHGWGGWDETENGETGYAEVMIDVRAHTESIINLDPIPSLPPSPDPQTRNALINALGSWTFEPHKLPEEQVVSCAIILFEALYRIEGMKESVHVELETLQTFLYHLQQIYRNTNTYHNFEHALDVFQAVYHFLWVAGVVPPVGILLEGEEVRWRLHEGSTTAMGAGTTREDVERVRSLISCLGLEDVFALCIAAVGHDVGHPGLNNAFMKNAQTPLALLYSNKSVLEQMHYSLLIQIMRHNGLGVLLDRRIGVSTSQHSSSSSTSDNTPSDRASLDDPGPSTFKFPLASSIPSSPLNPKSKPASKNSNSNSTSTSISTSNHISNSNPNSNPSTYCFRKLLLLTVLATDMSVHDEFMDSFKRLLDEDGLAGDGADEFKKKVLVCQALIKCADISNPCRPFDVAAHWAAALDSEWSSQLCLENYLRLPSTVKPSGDLLSTANSQVFFITKFARPLLELTSVGIQEMDIFARQCRENLRTWQDTISNNTPSTTNMDESTEPANHAPLNLNNATNPNHRPFNRSSTISKSASTSSFSSSPADFLSAFPPTLPKYFLTTADFDLDQPVSPLDTSMFSPAYSYQEGDTFVLGSSSAADAEGEMNVVGNGNGSRNGNGYLVVDEDGEHLNSDDDSDDSDDDGLSQYHTCESTSPSPMNSPLKATFTMSTTQKQQQQQQQHPPRLEILTSSKSSGSHSRTNSHSRLNSQSSSPNSYVRHNGSNGGNLHPHHHRPPSVASSHRAPSVASNRAPSIASSSATFNSASSSSTVASTATAAIRAAYKASVRKKGSKTFNRASWNPTPTEFYATLGRQPPAATDPPPDPSTGSFTTTTTTIDAFSTSPGLPQNSITNPKLSASSLSPLSAGGRGDGSSLSPSTPRSASSTTTTATTTTTNPSPLSPSSSTLSSSDPTSQTTTTTTRLLGIKAVCQGDTS